MLSSLVLVLILAAVGLAIIAEVLVAYEKHSLKRQMKEELDSLPEDK